MTSVPPYPHDANTAPAVAPWQADLATMLAHTMQWDADQQARFWHTNLGLVRCLHDGMQLAPITPATEPVVLEALLGSLCRMTPAQHAATLGLLDAF